MNESTSNKLCNATGFEADLDYERGIAIKVPPDGYIRLTVDQMHDFGKNNPGSEEAREKLYIRGLFLDDNERDYDSQALEALEKCVKLLKDRHRISLDNLQQQYIKADLKLDSPQFQERLRILGLIDLQERIEKLEGRIITLRKVVVNEEAASVKKLNPDLTCFVLDPPREFPSKTALKMFLDEHPETKKAHNAWLKQNQVATNE